jgi:hypothetical protein
MELSKRYNLMRHVLILLNSLSLVSGIFGVIRAVPQFKNNDDNYATHLTIFSSILILLSLIAIYSSLFQNSILLFAYGLCLFLSLFLTPVFWNTQFLSSNSTFVSILILVLILISMGFSMSLAMKIRNIRSEYENKTDK